MGTATALAQLLPVTLVAEIRADPFAPFGLSMPETMRVVDLRRSFGIFISNSWFRFKFERLLKQLRPNLVYARHGRLACELAGKGHPVIYEVHEILRDKYPGRSEVSKQEAVISSAAKGIIFISSKLRDRWHELYGQVRSAVIPSGTFYQENLKKDLVRGRLDTIYYVGTPYYEWKGINILFRALERIRGTRLVLVGDFSPEQVPETIRHRVDCLGHLPNKEARAVLNNAHITVLPNSSETVTSRLYTSPLKLLEYMAARTAIAASALPSVREIVTDREVLFFEPDNPAALARAIEELLQDEELRYRLAWSAWQKAARYSWEARANRIEGFVNFLL
ncbi:MAG: glycosyltransferase family 4 protein [Syntrophobacteria bacterium]